MQQKQPSQRSAKDVALDLAGSKRKTRLDVSTPAFANGESIPDKYAADEQNLSPPLTWSAGPAETQCYVVLMEDPDAPRETPFVHWMLYDVPREVTSLTEGAASAPPGPKLAAAKQGRNDKGSPDYFGMRPPPGHGRHHYHFEVFALDAKLGLPPGASRDELLDAMRGKVVASGEVVGTYQRP